MKNLNATNRTVLFYLSQSLRMPKVLFHSSAILVVFALLFIVRPTTGQNPTTSNPIFPTYQFPACDQYDERNTLWLNGPSSLSFPWDGLKSYLKNQAGYNFRDRAGGLYLFSTATGPNAPHIPTSQHLFSPEDIGGFFASNIQDPGIDNILGIGHDLGGLWLRAMAKDNPRIRALILDGVPNQGSGMLKILLTPTVSGSQITEIQTLIDRSKEIMDRNNCSGSDCGIVDGLESMVNNLVIVKPYYESAFPDHPFITDATPLDIPVLVLWGNVKELSLAELITAQAFNTTSNAYQGCLDNQLAVLQQTVDDAESKALIGNVKNFLSFLTSVLKGGFDPVSDPAPDEGFRVFDAVFKLASPADWISTLYTSVSSFFSARMVEVDKIAEANKNLAELLRCRLANDLLIAEWEFAIVSISGDYDLQSTTVTRPYGEDEFDDCAFECGVDEAFGDDELGPGESCDDYCDRVLGGTGLGSYGTTYILIPNNHDGILTEQEMQYDGAMASIELPDVNHISETKAFPRNEVRDVFEDIFNGAYGAAFCVPKQ